jgi:tRNA(Arg) A34 adenosine deaminase TadA
MLLESFQTYGWTPLPEISEDENWMDLLLLLTRSSQLKQGGMACILVQPRETNVEYLEQESLHTTFSSKIVSVGTNQPLFSINSSDIHAEIVAIGKAARRDKQSSKDIATEGCTAYITMPPCKNCFAALVAAGIRRIVTRYDCHCQKTVHAAARYQIELVRVKETLEQRERINTLVQTYKDSLAESSSEEASPQPTQRSFDVKSTASTSPIH